MLADLRSRHRDKHKGRKAAKGFNRPTPCQAVLLCSVFSFRPPVACGVFLSSEAGKETIARSRRGVAGERSTLSKRLSQTSAPSASKPLRYAGANMSMMDGVMDMYHTLKDMRKRQARIARCVSHTRVGRRWRRARWRTHRSDGRLPLQMAHQVLNLAMIVCSVRALPQMRVTRR